MVINNIQVLRAAAALMVVFVHVDKLLAKLGVLPFGYGGVDIFFVISGFIMVYTTTQRRTSAWSFFANRLARIAPIYWSITILVFCVALVAPGLLQATKVDWIELSKSLAFIPFVKSNGLVAPVLFVGWTLNYEMFFYAIFSVGLLLPTRIGALSVIGVLLALTAAHDMTSNVIGQFYTAPIMLEFGFGMIVGLLYPHFHAVGAGLKWLCLAAMALATYAVIVLPTVAGHVPVCGLAAMALVTCAIVLERSHWRITNRFVLLLGDASYSVYLTHPFVTQISQRVTAGLTHPGFVMMAIFATFAAIIVTGIAVHISLERPMSKLARQMLCGGRGAGVSVRVRPHVLEG